MTPKDMDHSKTNVIDLNQFREIETPSLSEIWKILPGLRREFGSRPAILRRKVDDLCFNDLKGRAALVADIRRELDHLGEALDSGPQPLWVTTPDSGAVQSGECSPVGNGGGLIWRLAMLNAYDALDD